MKTSHSISWARKSVYSALVFFGTLIVLSVGYAAWNAAMSKVTSWSLLTSTAWNALVDNIADIDSRWARSGANIAFTGGNVGIGVASPGEKLDVKGGHFRVLDRGDGLAGIIMATDAGGRMDMYLNSSNMWGVGVGGSVNQFNITSGGNVGIGTAIPQDRFAVWGTWDGWNDQIVMNVPTNNGPWTIQGKGDLWAWNMSLALNPSGGNIMVGTTTDAGYKLDVNGSVRGTSWTNSDRNLKKNIQTLSGALEKVGGLRGVTYEWKDSSRGTGSQVGVIAQEIETVFPELVHIDSQGIRAVNYASLVAPLIEAVKEQQKQISALQAEVRELKNKQ